MTKDDRRPKRNKKRGKKRSRSTTLHIVLVALVGILLIGAIIAAVRLMAWNEGKESEYDPDEVNTEFDTETEDYLLPLSEEARKLQKDDGVNTILLFGNGYVAKSRRNEVSMAKLLERYTGGRVYDASVNHSYLSTKYPQFDEDYPEDIFSLFWMVQCLVLDDFSPIINHARIWEGDRDIVQTVDMLQNLDMWEVDTILIAYDYHDYEAGRTLATPVDDTNGAPVSACASLGLSLRAIHAKFPHIRVVVTSPYYGFVEDSKGEPVNGETTDFGQGYLGDYMIAYKNVAVNNDASFVDNYFGTIHADNYEQYLDESHRDPTEEGVDLLAKRAAVFVGPKS